MKSLNTRALGAASAAVWGSLQRRAHAAWEPTRPVEFIVPAGTGGGADQMARTIQGIVTKHNLMKQPMVVINKAGGAGGEGFLDVKSSRGNPHKLIITLSNLFTTPLATGIPFNWKDLTPVAMLALDEFVLWVNADKPYKTAKEYIDAVKAGRRHVQDGRHRLQAGRPDHHRRDREGDRRQVHLHPVQAAAARWRCSSSAITSTRRVNNPIEAVAQWRGGKLRPLCVFDAKPLDYKDKIAGDLAWDNIPTCKSQGLDIEYLMLRGFFMPPGVDQGAGRLLRRAVQEGARDAGVEEADERRRLQPDLHDRRRLRQVGRQRREAPPGADEGSGLPRRQVTIDDRCRRRSDPPAASDAVRSSR